MLSKLFQKAGIGLLKQGLNAASRRHAAIASNLANVGSPGYQRREVEFEEKLRESMQDTTIKGTQTDPRHIPVGRGKVNRITPEMKVNPEGEEMASGMNDVDIDQEMADLAKNQLYFSANATLLARKFRGLKSAIRGRSAG